MRRRAGPPGRVDRTPPPWGRSPVGLSLILLLVVIALSTSPFAPSFRQVSGPPTASSAGLRATLGTSASSPLGNLSDVAIAYDAHRGALVAIADNVSNSTSGAGTSETWSWNGSTWTELAPSTEPPGRVGAALVADPTDGSILLFGGLGARGYLNDIWSWSGLDWSNLTPTMGPAPAPRAGASFAWDSGDHAAVLFGGVGSNGSTGLGSTWLFSGGRWAQANTSYGPIPPTGGALASDASTGGLVYAVDPVSTNLCTSTLTTWAFSNGTWSNLTGTMGNEPPARLGASLLGDLAGSNALLFGGSGCAGYRNDTWSLTSTGWHELAESGAPSGRSGALVAADSTGGIGYLFGGRSVGGPLGDIFEFQTGQWRWLGPELAVSGTIASGAGLAGDAGTNLTVAVQGALTVGPGTFAYAGLPSACVAPDLASFRCEGTSSGVFTLTGSVRSLSGFSALPELELTLHPELQIATLRVSPQSTEPGVPVTLTVGATGGTGAYAYGFAGLPMGCASDDTASLTCAPGAVGVYAIGVSVGDVVGGLSSEAVTLVVGPHPFVAAVNSTRPLLDVGQTTRVDVVASGGVGPLTFRFGGLPTGCASSNTTSLTCAPSSAGSFEVVANASDSYGFGGSAATTVTVDARLVVGAFTTNASVSASSSGGTTNVVTLGAPVAFSAVVDGGTPPISYAYTGLPVGCASSDASALPCTARSTGNFTITIVATDALGETATAALLLDVHPAAPSGGSSLPPTGSGRPSPGPVAPWELGSLVVALAFVAALGFAYARQGIARARRGHATVDGLLREAARLGDAYGSIDDPTRPPR